MPATPPVPEGAYVKTIVRGDADTDLTDALANLMHVHNGDLEKVAEAYDDAYEQAKRHYRNECDGVDGVTAEVV